MDQNRDPTTPKDASGDGQPLLKKRETASSRGHRLHIFSEVPVPPPSFFTSPCRTCSDVAVLSPSFYTTLCRSSSDVPVLSPSFYTTLCRSSTDVAVPPPSFFTSLCRTCTDVPVLSPSFYTTLCRSSSDVPVLSPSFYTSFCRSSSEIINFADLELSKPSTSLNLHHSPSQATGINPNISPLSPSPTKAGSTELPPPRTGVMPSGQGELLKPSSSQNLPSSPQAPWMNPNVSPLSPSPAKGASDQWPPLPVLRPAVSDLFLLSSLPTTGVLPTGHGDMPIGSPVIPQESLDQEVGELNCINFVFIFTSSFSVQYTRT